jgi:hypothetical protein
MPKKPPPLTASDSKGGNLSTLVIGKGGLRYEVPSLRTTFDFDFLPLIFAEDFAGRVALQLARDFSKTSAKYGQMKTSVLRDLAQLTCSSSKQLAELIKRTSWQKIDDTGPLNAAIKDWFALRKEQYYPNRATTLGAEEERAKFPSDLYSKKDRVKIAILEKNFRANASAFNYTSAEIPEVEINGGTLLPALGDITLREVLKRNVKSESSASDFVRLIWAFLLAVYQTSSTRDYEGNHPSVLMFDEPGQHSMSETSQKALVNLMSGLKQLQSILAASFDESVAVFDRVTEGSSFHLIELPEKFIGPMRHDGAM